MFELSRNCIQVHTRSSYHLFLSYEHLKMVLFVHCKMIEPLTVQQLSSRNEQIGSDHSGHVLQ